MLRFDSQYAAYDVTAVANQFILEYMPSAKGEYVKVYLYGLMLCGHPQEDMTLARMAHELSLEEETVAAAFRHWEYAGLVERVQDDPPEYRYVHPVWRSFLSGETRSDPVYQAFMEDLHAIFEGKRNLHGFEKRKAWEWVEELQLPPEVVLILVRHLVSSQGVSFRFGGKEPERLAQMLATEKARSVEDAMEVLGREKAVEDGAADVLRRFRSRRRVPTQDEAALSRKWVREWHFTPEAVLEACAETTKGSPTFAYLDAILAGIRERGAAGDVEALRGDLDENSQVREMLRALGSPNAVLNEGTRAAYQRMRRLYPHEIILLAARQCSTQHLGLDEVEAGLERWRQRGLQTEAEVQRFIEAFNAQGELLRSLGEVWGKRIPGSQKNRELVDRWQNSLHLDREMILHCAAWASDAEKAMPYLDRLLSALQQQGVTTPAAADAAHEAWRQSRSGEGKTPGRTVSAQQYEQRDYSQEEPEAMPEWMMARWEEMQKHGQ